MPVEVISSSSNNRIVNRHVLKACQGVDTGGVSKGCCRGLELMGQGPQGLVRGVRGEHQHHCCRGLCRLWRGWWWCCDQSLALLLSCSGRTCWVGKRGTSGPCPPPSPHRDHKQPVRRCVPHLVPQHPPTEVVRQAGEEDRPLGIIFHLSDGVEARVRSGQRRTRAQLKKSGQN